jgi:predicted transposase YdaD
MQESTLYQEIYKKGVQEGIEKGLQEGIEKGLQEGVRKQQDTLIFLLEERFGKVPVLLKTAIFGVTADKKLKLLFKEVVKTDSLKTFQNFMEKKILHR